MEAGKRAPHTQTPPRSTTGQVPAFHLAALLRVRRWSRWSRLYGVWVPGAAQPSRWLLRTIWLDYAIQFARCPPKFRGIHLTAVKAADAHDFWEESLSYWRRTWWYRSLQPIWRQGFSALTSLCPRKAVGYDQSWVCASWCSRCSCRTASSDASVPSSVCSIDLKTRTSMCRSFRATGHSCGLRSKDEHISTGPALRAVPIAPCLHESSGGSPCSLERTGRAHSQLPRRLAHTGSVSGSVMRTQGLVLSHLSQLGLRVNWEKSKLLPMQRISFLGMEFGFGQSDSAPHAGTRSVGVELLEYVQEQDGGTTETSFRGSWGIWRLQRRSHRWGCSIWDRFNTGSMAESRGGRGRAARLRVQVTPACRQTFTPWSDPSFLRAGVPLEQVSGHAVVYTDASAKGWGGHVQQACSVGGLDGSPTALAYQLPRVAGSTPGLEPSQETLTRRARTGPYGQHCDRCVHQPTRWSTLPSHLARHLLLWSRKHLRSLRAIHIPGLLNRTGRRAVTSCAPPENGDSIPRRSSWFATFWTRTGRHVRVPRDVALPVVLLPDRRNTRHGRTGTQLAAGPSQICISPSEPSRTDTVQGQGGRGADPARGTILAYQDLVPRADAPRDSPSLADSSEEVSTDSETGHLMAPASRSLETSCLVPRWDAEVLGDLPQEVVDTITSARAPSTRHAYALKWNLFVEWCSSHRENPRRCPIRVVLSFLQQGLERRLSPSTLRSTWPRLLPTTTLWKGSRWGSMTESSGSLGGARRLNPPRPPPLYPLGTCP